VAAWGTRAAAVGDVHDRVPQPVNRGFAAHLVNGFRKGLSETGFSENQNVVIEYRWAEGHYERLPQLAADLVNRKVVVIVAAYLPAALAAKAATSTIPIVFISGVDPVAAGLVGSLRRPGGNLTGLSNFNTSLTASPASCNLRSQRNRHGCRPDELWHQQF
jgi:ABC-type uncharacterized transport system substrate-binding protein